VRTELVVPNPQNEVIPVGWWDSVARPAVEGWDWEMLDEWEERIAAAAAFCEALHLHGPSFEYRCALRLIEKRRGELLGPVVQGAHRQPDADEDVAPRTAHNYRKLAEHWDDVLYPHLLAATAKANPDLATQTQLLRLIREHTPARPDASVEDVEAEGWAARHGDFREVLGDLPDGSVDLIVTDPPYPKEDLPLWSDLAKVAARLLGPRGLLFAWSGQIFLPEVLQRVGEHLTYGWTFALLLPGSGSRIMGRHVMQAWKPVVAFSTGTWPSGEWGDDLLLSPERDKTEYEWQQHAAPARRLIERYSPPGGLVVDPFLGTGAFGVAAIETERRFLGVELDAKRYRSAVDRLRSI
jgi:site-specific DNA-methyltransferase (adenine-specific)